MLTGRPKSKPSTPIWVVSEGNSIVTSAQLYLLSPGVDAAEISNPRAPVRFLVLQCIY